MKLPTLPEVKKALTALGAGVTAMVTAGLLTGDAAVWLTGAITAVGIALAVYAGPANNPKG